MNLIFDEELLPEPELVELMQKAAKICLEQHEIYGNDVEISVTFVSNEEIKSINATHRSKDVVTDVLSFPQFEEIEEIKDQLEDEYGPIILGDVVIASEVAKTQAEEYGHSYQREVVYLLVHSILHLLGYDHIEAEEKNQMREAEEKVMKEIGLER